MSSHILVPDPGEKFFAACGGRDRAPHLRIHGGGAPFDFELRRPFVLVGRSERCDLRFDHPDVSYRHAYLQLAGGRLCGFDLASRTGTRWSDGSRIAGRFEPHSSIAIGPYSIENLDGTQSPRSQAPPGNADPGRSASHAASDSTWSIESDFCRAERSQAEPGNEPTAEPGNEGFAGWWRPDAMDSSILAGAEALAADDLPPAYLGWADDGARPRAAPLKRAITLLGWSKSCHARFSRDQVSRVHASLVLSQAGVWIVDLLGRGGTLLDGKRVAYARLRDGSELQIGTLRFRLRLGEPPRPAARRRRPRDRSANVVIHQNIVIGSAAAGGAPPVNVSTSAPGTVEVRPPGGEPRIAPPATAAAPGPPPTPAHLSFPGSAWERGSAGERGSAAERGQPPAVPAPPAASTGGLSEGFVLSLLDQFARMQRDMAAQNHEQMLLFAQTIGSLHHSQQDLVREELQRVHHINRELQLIQAQLLGQTLGSGTPSQPRLTGGADVVDAAFDFETPADGSDVIPLDAIPLDAIPLDDVIPLGDEAVPLPGSQAEPGSGRSQAEPGNEEAAPRTATRGVEQHAWLMDRMSRLERERRSRWRKIMSLLTGGARG